MLVKDLIIPVRRGTPADTDAGLPGEAPEPLPTLSHRFPAWMLSLTLHTLLLLALGLMVRVTHRGAGLELARGGGIVLARNVDGAEEYFGEGDVASEEALDSPSQSAASALPTPQEMPLDVTGALPSAALASAGTDLGDALPSASGLTGGMRPSGGQVSGNQAKTSIFGAEGVGTKFAYVFDRSASMNGYQGRPLRAAKAELIASLQDLDKIHQFQIIFYNEHPTVFNPSQSQSPSMLFGDEPTKRLAQNFVRGVIAAGSTRHLEAIEMALGTQPDVIFFLTDANEPQLTSSQLESIRRYNRRVGATIHAIEFGAGPNQGGLNFLRRLAEQNGGSYVYVDVTRLPAN